MSGKRMTAADMAEAERLRALGDELAKQYHDQCRADLVQRIEAAIVAWQAEWKDVRATEYLAAALRRVTKDCPIGAEIQFTRTLRPG
jgi:hypothetical protein